MQLMAISKIELQEQYKMIKIVHRKAMHVVTFKLVFTSLLCPSHTVPPNAK
jgi:hypothetical protein